ncbi:MAG: beta-lactamase family protein [Lachnospiraceae bacterium]|nr:beta-lactamase family protein [Lachnospiraceae bacterium]
MTKIKPDKKRIFLACVVMAALLVVVGILRMNAQKDAKEQANVTAKTLMDQYTKRQMGLCLGTAVIDGDTEIVQFFGENGVTLKGREEEQYEIGSLTKTFVGALFGKYVSEGKVSLSDPVSRYVDFHGKYDPTILELLTHTSAYEDYRTNGFWQSARHRFGKNPYQGISTDKIPVYMRRFSTGDSAPYGYSFSNFGYAVLGNVIEAVEGKSAAEAIEAYAKECGLSNTVFVYEPEEKQAWKWNATDAFLPAAGLSSDLSDLISWARLYFDDAIDPGRTLSITPQKNAEGTDQIGFGWGIRRDGVIGHGGETSNYSAQMLLDSVNHRAVIVLSNRAKENGITVSQIAEQIYKEQFDHGE